MTKWVTLTLLMVFPFFVIAQDADVIRLSDPVESTADYEVFGAPVGSTDDVRRLSEIIEDADRHDGQQVFVKASVAKVCQKKGCFFIARDGDDYARVTFVDYGFFVPTDSGGKTVTIVGKFSKTIIDEEKARHYAMDAGDDPRAISGPLAEYGIVATSVIIPKT